MPDVGFLVVALSCSAGIALAVALAVNRRLTLKEKRALLRAAEHERVTAEVLAENPVIRPL